MYTNRPSICSTSYLAWEIIERLIEKSDSVFFYVLFPPNRMELDDWRFLGRHKDRVTLLPLIQSTSDRVSEEFMLRNQLRFYLNPWCAHTWDADVVISSRIPMLKYYRTHSSRELGKSMRSHRMYVGLEEMPILPFRDTVPWSDVMYPDTLISYGMLDAVLIQNQWTKGELRPYLKEVLSIAWQKRVLENLHEVVPVKLQRLNLKIGLYKEGDFEVAFVGRVTGTRNFEGAVDLFRSHFSYPIGPNRNKMKFRVSTNSMSMGGRTIEDIECVDIQKNDRPKFHEFLKGIHVAVNLTTVEDFSLSTYETLLAGVPIIVKEEPWNAFLGPYPFRVKNDVQAFAMLSKFVEDYEGEYKKFVVWEQSYWKSYVEGPMNITTSERLGELVQSFVGRRKELLDRSGAGGSYKEQIAQIPTTDGCLDLTAYIKSTGKMFDKVEEHFSLAIGRVPSTIMLKLCAEQLGYKDTNKTGVMRKILQ